MLSTILITLNQKHATLKSNWLRHKGNAFYTLWQLKPGFEFLAEDKQDKLDTKGFITYR